MQPDRLLLIIVIIFGAFFFLQQYQFEATGGAAPPRNKQTNRPDHWVVSAKAAPKKAKKQRGMAACLMVRDDNALLYEWLAYHYTILPLRHVMVGMDLNSTQDPRDILNKWESTNLKFTVRDDSDFIYRHGEIPVGSEDENHHYLHRQRGFISVCAEYMKDQGESWVVFADTDEFVVLNHINKDDDVYEKEEMDTESVRYKRFQQRHVMTSANTVLDAIKAAKTVAPLNECHVIPRLLVGALETETCPDMDATKSLIQSRGFDYERISTVRYVQTANKNQFHPSKWGKVMVDVSKLDDEVLASKPKSAHRPFMPACPKPLILFEEALVHIMHYLGSWERYDSREDARRSREAFEERAYFSERIACDMRMDQWFLDFVNEFGVKKAKYLLGMSSEDE